MENNNNTSPIQNDINSLENTNNNNVQGSILSSEAIVNSVNNNESATMLTPNTTPDLINNNQQVNLPPANETPQDNTEKTNEDNNTSEQVNNNSDNSEKKEETKEELSDEEKIKIAKKQKQKKQLIILGIVILIILGASWYILSNRNNNQTTIIIDPNALLTEKEAESLINDEIVKIIDIYENQEKTFEIKKEEVEETEEENKKVEDYIIVTNYDKIVKDIFSENGIKELESTTFNKKQFVVKDEETVKILKEIPKNNRLKENNVAISMIKVKQNEITAQATFTTYGLEEDVVTYYVIVKNIKLVKSNDKWLTESFQYVNE